MLTAATLLHTLCVYVRVSLCCFVYAFFFLSFVSDFYNECYADGIRTMLQKKATERKHYFLMLSNLFITFHNRSGSQRIIIIRLFSTIKSYAYTKIKSKTLTHTHNFAAAAAAVWPTAKASIFRNAVNLFKFTVYLIES